MFAPWKKSYDQPRQHIKKQTYYFANKFPSSESYVFSSRHVLIWELNHKESWALKNWCFWTVVLRRVLRVPWTARRSNQSILKEISPEYSLEGWCWSWSSNTLATWWEELTHWKRSWCWERLRTGGEVATEGEIVGWYHRLNGHEREQTPGDREGQRSLACCSPWGHKESDTAEQHVEHLY